VIRLPLVEPINATSLCSKKDNLVLDWNVRGTGMDWTVAQRQTSPRFQTNPDALHASVQRNSSLFQSIRGDARRTEPSQRSVVAKKKEETSFFVDWDFVVTLEGRDCGF
jgi:hypothetical protein